MRIALAILLVMAIPGLGAQTVIPANAITITWDPVTTLENGDPVPSGDSVGYEILYSPAGDYTGAVLDGETTAPPYTVNLPGEGVFAIGVRTVRIVAATSERRESAINWSDVNGAATPDPFWVSVYRAPSAVAGLRAIVP